MGICVVFVVRRRIEIVNFICLYLNMSIAKPHDVLTAVNLISRNLHINCDNAHLTEVIDISVESLRDSAFVITVVI